MWVELFMWYLVLQFRSMFLPRNGTCLLVVFPVTSAIETIFCKWISHMDDDEHDERSLGHMSSRTAGNNVFEFAEYTTVLPRHRPAAYPHKTLFIFLIFFSFGFRFELSVVIYSCCSSLESTRICWNQIHVNRCHCHRMKFRYWTEASIFNAP